MAGAIPLTTVGSGYVINGLKEPDVTIKTCLDRFHVCIRRSKNWKEIVAEFSNENHAEWFKNQLEKK